MTKDRRKGKKIFQKKAGRTGELMRGTDRQHPPIMGKDCSRLSPPHESRSQSSSRWGEGMLFVLVTSLITEMEYLKKAT